MVEVKIKSIKNKHFFIILEIESLITNLSLIYSFIDIECRQHLKSLTNINMGFISADVSEEVSSE